MSDEVGEEKIALRKWLLEEKSFLCDLSGSHRLRVRHILNLASTEQLKLLVHVLYHLTNGEMPLKKQHFEDIIRSKKLNILKQEFGTKKLIDSLLEKPRAVILERLYKVQSVIAHVCANLKR
jgi:hypothetical protein